MIFAVFDVLLAVNMCINYSFFKHLFGLMLTVSKHHKGNELPRNGPCSLSGNLLITAEAVTCPIELTVQLITQFYCTLLLWTHKRPKFEPLCGEYFSFLCEVDVHLGFLIFMENNFKYSVSLEPRSKFQSSTENYSDN